MSVSFSYALNGLKQGKKLQRTGWNGKGMWIALHTPSAYERSTLPYLYMKTATGDYVPWLASQTDILAEDWEYVE